MKILLHTLTYCFIVTQIFAQSTPDFREKGSADWRTFKATEQVAATELKRDKARLELGTHDELTLLHSKTDALGFHHHRYQQTYKGIPIEGAIYLMHEKNKRVQQTNGKLIRQLNLTTTPAISEVAALQAALRHVDADLYAWNDPEHEDMLKQSQERPNATFYPDAELVIIAPDGQQKADDYRLAYKLDIYAIEPMTRQLVYIDAQNGTVLTTLEKIHNCTDVPASGATNYSGDVNFATCYSNGTHILKDEVGGVIKQVYNALNTWGFPPIPFTDTDGYFESDPVATEVHWATQKTFEYFLNTHQRNSLNDKGMTLKSWVHYRTKYNNAFWNGSWMTYGDGDNIRFTSLTAPDVVAHEMTHGITDFSADLVYRDESGALNESFSDIFGEVAERYMRGTNDWLMGADFTVEPGKTTLRNLSNPNDPTALTQQPDTYHGDFWYYGTGNRGGVHYNSGVQNYWFYLLSEGGSGINDNDDAYDVSGIGMDKAATIAYRSLTTYLTPHAEYADARNAALQAAIDLYGLDSYEAEQTALAWCAVGVGGCSFVAPCRRRDSLALVALYDATNGANWTNTWDLNEPMDEWYGVTLDGNGCVFEVKLGGNQLNGVIPTEVGNLSNLTYLSLTTNQLAGSIPAEIGNLINLESLILWDNNLSGGVPVELGNLINLKFLYLNNNPIEGTIPSELGNLISLEGLGLSNNQLTGNIPLEIVNLENLKSLDLSSNELVGNVPREIGNLSKLSLLYISHNQLSGIIPPEIGNLKELIGLSMSDNLLTGMIPTELGELDKLKSLSIHNNQLSGNLPTEFGNMISLEHVTLYQNQLIGEIPYELGNLNKLTRLNVNTNLLSGSIPASLGNLNNLEILYVSDNQLSGCYSANLANLCSQLISDFNSNSAISSGNNFTTTWEDFCNTGSGTCPYTPPPCRQSDSLALVALYNATNGPNWTNTWDLSQPMDTWYGVTLENGCVSCIDMDGEPDCILAYAGGNNLSGGLPPEIGNLNDLIYLNLGYNNDLTGNIPYEIGNLNNLEFLRMNGSGTIPAEVGNLTNLTYLYLRGGFTDNIPPEIGNLTNLIHLNLGGNLTGSIPVELCNLTNLTSLDLYNNELTGSIPPEIGNLVNLIYLDLFNNDLTGNIPVEIGNLTKLASLTLIYNQLSGSIPPELGNLINLASIHLHGNWLTGDIPTEIGNLYNLTQLDLSNNRLTGNIPRGIGNLTNLTTFSVSNNQLTGCYDSDLINLCGQLFSGYNTNSRISDGNNFTTDWESFCATGAGVCDPVYPGDFDNNGIVDIHDVLMWGLSTNNSGPPRHNATTAWTPQACIDWQAIINGINAKYQDGNGDGINNVADLQAWATNFDSTHTVTSFTFTDSPLQFRLEEIEQTITNGEITTTYGLIPESRLNTPVSVHGLTFSMYLGSTPTLNVRTDTVGSPLSATIMEEKYDSTHNTYHVALTRTDLNNQLINGAVAKIIVVHDDLQAGEPLAFVLNGGTMSATGDFIPVDDTAFHGVLGIAGAGGTLSVGVSVTHESCYTLGSAIAQASDGMPPYTYMWSNGANTAYVGNLTNGVYNVEVVDYNGDKQNINIQVNSPEPLYDQLGNSIDCSQNIQWASPQIHVLLEGAYQTGTGNMRVGMWEKLTKLPPIQPYGQAPWNYRGKEGNSWSINDYPTDIVDWVLVSFRDANDFQKVHKKTAALVLQDGYLHLPDMQILPNASEPMYIMIQHRNHIATMTPQPVSVINNSITYDFRATNGYNTSTSIGQKQMSDGNWALFAGDCDPLDTGGYDVNGQDKTMWSNSNGNFGQYLPADLNLDGDINGSDKILWERNNGNSSALPK